MIITCKECDSSFKIDDGLIEASGSKVRCSKCKNVFEVYPPEVASVPIAEDPPVTADEDLHMDDLDMKLDELFEESDESSGAGISPESTWEQPGAEELLAGDVASESAETPDGNMDDFELDLQMDETGDQAEEMNLAGVGEAAVDVPSPATDLLDEREIDLNLDLDEETEPQLLEAFEGDAETELQLDGLDDFENIEDAPASMPTEDELIGDLDLDLKLDDSEFGATGHDELPGLEGLVDLENLPETDPDVELAGFDLDLEPDAETEVAGLSEPLAPTEATDLPDLDFDFEETSASTAQTVGTAGDEELDFDFGDAEELADIDGEASDDNEDFDLSALDLDTDKTEVAPVEPGDSEEDIQDLGLDLEPDAVAGMETEPEAGELEADELDLSDLEDIIGGDAGKPETQQAMAAEDLDLDLDLDAGPETEATIDSAPAADDDLDELDFSDLEQILEEDEAPVLAAEEDSGSEDADLQLDLDFDENDTAAVASGEAIEDMEELEMADLEDDAIHEPAAGDTGAALSEDDLGLDLDFEVDSPQETTGADADFDATDELDFSDLENMLQEDEAPVGKASAEASDDDLDLDFEVDLDDGADKAGDELSVPAMDAEQNDFMDIEKMLEEGEVADSKIEPAEELDFDLEMDESPVESPAAGGSEVELDFDLDDDLEEPIGDAVQQDELEFNLLEDDDAVVETGSAALATAAVGGTDSVTYEAGATTDDFATEEFTDTRSLEGDTDILGIEEDELPVTTSAPAGKRKPLLIILLLLVLAVGLVIIPKVIGVRIPFISDINIPYISDLDLKIPYLSDLISGEEKDVSGNLRLTPLDKSITAKFVTNSKSGKLFVVRGQIRNEYDHPRNFIKVTGKLYRGGKKSVGASTIYAGNMLSTSELAVMDYNAIKKRLNNKFGDKKSNYKVKTGRVVPFMVVFNNLPNNLGEYTIEVAGSSE